MKLGRLFSRNKPFCSYCGYAMQWNNVQYGYNTWTGKPNTKKRWQCSSAMSDQFSSTLHDGYNIFDYM